MRENIDVEEMVYINVRENCVQNNIFMLRMFYILMCDIWCLLELCKNNI